MSEDNLTRPPPPTRPTPRRERRIRVRLDFEIAGPGLEVFPDWLLAIVTSGIESLQDDGAAPKPIKYFGCRYNFSQVDEATLKRRVARAAKKDKKP